jgi:hypothetical protein
MFVETKREGEVITREPWRQVLSEAAAILEIHGWIRGYLENGNGYCLIGALRVTHASDLDKHEAAVRFAMRLNIRSLAGWNDAPKRTKGEVIAALRTVAIEKWEWEHSQ